MSLTNFAWGNRAAPARLAATATALFGLAALCGRTFGLPALTSFLSGSAQMKANTALLLILSGISELVVLDRASVRLDRIAQALALVVIAVGLATFAEYLFDWQFGIDELLIKDGGGPYNVFRGRMSPFSALAFVLIGTAIAAMPSPRLKRLSDWAAALVIVIGSTSLIGYLWHAGELTTDRWLPPVALNTAVCFVLLGAGILLSPRRSGTQLDWKVSALARIEIKILGGFLFAMALLLFGGSYTYRASVEFANSVEWVAHTHDVSAALADLRGKLSGAQLAQRDYLLTSDQERWDDYLQFIGDVQIRLADLGQLTSDNPTQQQNLVFLKSAVDARLREMSGVAAALHGYGIPAARAVLRIARLARNKDDVKTAIGRMESVEAALLRQRDAESQAVRQTTLISLLITLVAAAGLFIASFRGIHREMLARRDAEDALRASEQYNRSIVDASPDCLAILTLDARISHMAPRGLRLMEIQDFPTIENTDWLAAWVGEDLAAARLAVDAARNGSAGRFRGSCPTRTGTQKWWDVIVMPIRGADGNVARLLAVARDITEVKRAENELLETNRFLDFLVDNLPAMVFVKDAQTRRYVRQNRATLELLGLTKEDVIGKTDRDFLPAEQADFIAAKDSAVLAANGLVDVAEQSVSSKQQGVRVLHTKKASIFDEYGNAKYIVGISVDITERKQADQAIRKLNAELVANAAQLEATNKELESFSYSVSHDLRAPLRAIDGFALMLQEDCQDKLDDEGRRYLTVIRDNSRRMGALIDDLLSFSRLGRQPVADREVNVEALVREVIEEAVGGAPAPRIQVDTLPNARGDRGLLRQVWVNLIANAIKYSSKAAQPLIQISGREVGSENEYSVRDNGVGFNMAYVGKLFGVFQRLHRADEFGGTGVGLAIVHRVVSRHGGRVWASGEVDGGAVFSFALPNGHQHE